MKNFGGIQPNMTYMMQQMGGGQEFPVPITANQNAAAQPRKQRNNKKFLAQQALPPQQQQLRMMQQPQQLQPYQQAPPPPQQQQPPPPQLQQIESMGQITQGPIVPPPIAQQQRKTQIRQVPPVVKGQPPLPPPQINIDRDTFFMLSESLCSFSWMDSIETDWIGDKINPEIVENIDKADDADTDLDFNSITYYINASNNLFQQK